MSDISSIKKSLVFVIIIVTLFSQNLFSAQALPEFSATYAVQKYGIKLAEAHFQLRHTKTGYKITQETNLYGIANVLRNDTVTAFSYVDEINEKLYLTKHTYKVLSKGNNQFEELSIQWDRSNNPARAKISGFVNGDEINLETDSAVWDALSFQIPLMIDANPERKEYPYNAIIKGEINPYHFILKSTKSISFEGKEYTVLHMVRSHPRKNRQLHVWLAPELHNMPMTVVNYRDGKEFSRMEIESIKFNNNKETLK